MKNNKLELFFVLMVFLVLITTVLNNNATTENENNDIYSNQSSNIEFHPNFSKSWSNFTHIHLTGENWTTAKSYGWVTGSGSYLNPYILENMTINAGNYRSGIIIENSNVYFIIRNCTIRNTGSSTEDAGIKLINVNNSRISGNNFFDIDRIGIYLKMSCTNNTISYNYLFEDYPYVSTWMRYGIYLYDQCSNNSIKNNILHGINRFSSTERGGIHLEDNCNFNKIENNLVNQCMHGIYLINYCDENKLFNNSIIDNDGDGISISVYADSNKIVNNTIYDNTNGIYVNDHCNDIIVENNTLFNNGDHGIYFINGCEYNTIANNTIYQNEVGIKVHTSGSFCQYYNISGNILNNNLQYGIHLIAVMYVDLWENKMSNCGIYYETTNIIHHRRISISTNNTVNGKPVYHYVDKDDLDSTDFTNAGKAGQIILANCNNSDIRNLKLTNCSIGLYMYKCNKNTIFNITTNQNTIGIDLHSSHRNLISNTTTKENIEAGIDLSYCDNNKIFDSTMIYNDVGIGLGICFNNTISNCTVEFNRDTGIYLGASDNNTLIKNTICNNSYEGTSFDAAIFSNGGCYNKIFQNYICNNSNNGIYLWYSSDGNFISHNNTIYNNGLNGIYLEHECVNNTISNNIVNYNKNGIYFETDCIKNYISENRILNNDENGIYFLDSSNNNVKNNNIDKNNQNGIYLDTSDNINISGNFFNENKVHGIYLDECINSIISLNYFTYCGVYITGSLTELKSHQIDITNEINKKKLCYYADQSGLDSSIFNNAGQIILVNCSDTFISNVNVSSGSIGLMLYLCDNITIKETNSSYNKLYGIYLEMSNNTVIIDNTINGNTIGIYLQGDYSEDSGYYNNITGNQISFNVQYGILFTLYCQLNQIIGNNISYNGMYGVYLQNGCNNNTIQLNEINSNTNHGIYIYSSDNNIILDNNIYYNGIDGIKVEYWSSYNTIRNNTISYNQNNGITLDMSDENEIIDNYINGNSIYGLRVGWAGGNKIYTNYFINNTINAIDNGYTNSWDNGSLGNYWDDYTGGDNNNDGIGDIPYYVPGSAGSIDNYPIWGEPSNEAGELSIGENDSSEGKDNEQSSDNLTTYILGGVIIGSIIAIYFGLQVYSKKHPLRKSVMSKEPFLESSPEEADQSNTKKTTTRTPQSKSTTKKSESYLQKPIGIDDFDQHFIQEKLRIKALKTTDLYDEIIRKNSIISKYLESDISIDDIPDGERLVATTLSEEDFRKIDLIDLPANDKKIFLMEILSLNTKERKTILDDLIQNVD